MSESSEMGTGSRVSWARGAAGGRQQQASNQAPSTPPLRLLSPSVSSAEKARLPAAYCWQAASWKSSVSTSVAFSSASSARTSAASARSDVMSMACVGEWMRFKGGQGEREGVG